MKTRLSSRQGERGYALIMVMLFMAISLTILSSTMSRTTNTSLLNERNNQYSTSMSAAEAATEKVLARMITDYRLGGESRAYNNLDSYKQSVPTSSENAYWSSFHFNNAQGTASRLYVARITNVIYTPLQSQYAGLQGFASTYRVISNARQLDGYFNMTNAVQQEIQLASIPVFQFAIFYNSLLEFTWAAPLTVRGRVHANGDIYTGSSSPLAFHSAVTSTGTIQKRGWAGYSLSAMTGSINYYGGKDTNASTLSLPIGTNNTAAAVRELIYPPPSGEAISSEMGQQRYYNKAELIIEINSSGTATAKVKQPYDSTSTSISSGQLSYFVNTTKTFTDQREGKTVKATEIDIAKYRTWAATNTAVIAKLGAGTPPNLVYVNDQRSLTSSQIPAVRLINGETLPTRGLTLATPNPLYVKGHYNAPTSSHRGTTNTSNTKPASLVSDALTILSPNWNDSDSNDSYSDRDATDTTVNAAIITGVVFTGGSSGTNPFSGGAMNITRLLEDWGNGSKKLTLNTSIVNLFDSARATAPWQVPGTYYKAPTRDFNFDNNFTDAAKQPPGTPELRALIRGRWSNPPPNTINYAGS